MPSSNKLVLKYLPTILVCSGCCNKIPYIVLLKQQKFIFSQFWSLEVQDQGASKAGYW